MFAFGNCPKGTNIAWVRSKRSALVLHVITHSLNNTPHRGLESRVRLLAIMPGRNILLSILAMPDGLSPLPLHTHAHSCTHMHRQGWPRVWPVEGGASERHGPAPRTAPAVVLGGPHSPAYWACSVFLRVSGLEMGEGLHKAIMAVAFLGPAHLLCPLEASRSEQEGAPAPAHHQLLWDKFPPEDSPGLSPALIHFLASAPSPWSATCFFPVSTAKLSLHPCISKLACCWHAAGT